MEPADQFCQDFDNGALESLDFSSDSENDSISCPELPFIQIGRPIPAVNPSSESSSGEIGQVASDFDELEGMDEDN